MHVFFVSLLNLILLQLDILNLCQCLNQSDLIVSETLDRLVELLLIGLNLVLPALGDV